MSNVPTTGSGETIQKATGNGFFVDLWVNLKRWLVKSIRTKFVVAGALVQPVFFLVLFTVIFGEISGSVLADMVGSDVSYVTFIIPAIITLSALDTATASGIGLVDDMGSGMFDKVLVSPMNRVAMFLGKSLSEVVRIVVQTGIILVLGYLMVLLEGSADTYLQTGLLGLVGIFCIAILFSLWFTAFSNIVALVTRDRESTIIGVNLLQLPVLFLSSAFLPLDATHWVVQTVATYNPATYGIDAIRAFMLGRDVLSPFDVTAFGGIWNTVVPSAAILAGFAAVFGSIAVYLLNRASSSGVR
jgi:ABC-2 type transport system permease protein